ncbi:hypothetical protein HAX54_046126 [Datura stramonium]|uniref:Uncharacterized protein n=1 Tax=Datura stramonium TaxID=4076 RepID=A0ABS8SR84_DATST|nr:hypothetical protein [Datura stramonium]
MRFSVLQIEILVVCSPASRSYSLPLLYLIVIKALGKIKKGQINGFKVDEGELDAVMVSDILYADNRLILCNFEEQQLFVALPVEKMRVSPERWLEQVPLELALLTCTIWQQANILGGRLLEWKFLEYLLQNKTRRRGNVVDVLMSVNWSLTQYKVWVFILSAYWYRMNNVNDMNSLMGSLDSLCGQGIRPLVHLCTLPGNTVDKISLSPKGFEHHLEDRQRKKSKKEGQQVVDNVLQELLLLNQNLQAQKATPFGKSRYSVSPYRRLPLAESHLHIVQVHWHQRLLHFQGQSLHEISKTGVCSGPSYSC